MSPASGHGRRAAYARRVTRPPFGRHGGTILHPRAGTQWHRRKASQDNSAKVLEELGQRDWPQTPVILSLHPELDARQREVVGHVDGPLPGIAGPGAGKTQSIQLRAINLLLTGEAAAGELLLCTFGSDARQ